MKKIALFLVSVLLFLGNVMGQGRFEWVRGYAPGEHVCIVGSVTDSVGNLYILGSFNFESRWENGELIMPITPHNGAQNGVNTLIAKISPEGEMVWKKVIHGNAYLSQPHDIKAVGDTAFACLVTMPLATDYNWYLYYLDTLVEPNWDPKPDYPMSAEGVDYRCLALITFDFDGNVLEQHFLQMSYLDRYGEDVYYVSGGANDFLSTNIPAYPSFDIDDEGNVYLCRYMSDKTLCGPGRYYTLWDGDISAVKFWCDRRPIGTIPIDSTKNANSQLLKFAPHLDTLLVNRFVYQNDSIFYSAYTHMKTDEMNRLILLGDIQGVSRGGTNYFDSANTMGISMYRNHHAVKSFIIRYDSLFNPERLVCFRDSIIDSSRYRGTYFFHDVGFDSDSNLMFVTGSAKRNSVGDTSSAHSFFVLSDSVTSLRHNSFVLILNKDEMSLRDYGQLSTSNRSNSETYLGAPEQFVCRNNRIFLQYIYYGRIKFPNATFQTPNLQVPGIGLAIFDYRGKLISGFDYASYSMGNQPGPMVMRDSTLYLINKLSSDATFGDIHVPSRGDYFACIAKYVDTAFMTPYVRRVTEDTTIRVEVVQEEWTRVLYPNPTSGRVTVVMNGRPLRELYVAEMDGIAEPLPFSAMGDGRYAADLTGRPDGAYVLVMISDDKHAYRSTLILQR